MAGAMRKPRVSEIMGVTAVLLAVGGYFGFHALSSYLVGRERFAPVPPGRVNLVGITPGAGYRIIIANDVAQLVETQGDFGGSEKQDEGATEGAIKRRVPMRELLGVLRGDGKALGPFVMIMNGVKQDEWPPIRIDWTKADLEKAIGGTDAKLRAKLERDLNVRLDGTPIVPLNRNSLENGIMVHAPVELTVNLDGKPTVVRGETIEPYKPSLIKAVESRYQDKPNVDATMIAGYYAEEVRRVAEKPSAKEDVGKSIRALYSKERTAARLDAPQRLLKNATVVLNETYIDDARYRSYKTNDGKTLSDLTVDLNDEGRRRLWQFSLDRVGSQILLIADDVAIAAPRIEHELALREFTITQMRDEVLVRDAVDSIRGTKGRTASK